MARGRKRLAFIGGTEKGKSTQIKKMAIHQNERFGEPIIILDENNQQCWWQFPEITFDQYKRMKKGIYRIVSGDFKLFYKITYDNFQGGHVIHEDTSNCFTAQKDMDVFPNFIALRHPDHNNDFTGVFHSILDCPPYVIRQLNEIFLFKTNDVWKMVKDRFPTHLQDIVKAAFDRVNAHPDQYYFERIILQKTGTK